MQLTKQQIKNSDQKTGIPTRTLTYVEAVNYAAALSSAGKLDQAERLCLDIIRGGPNDFNALHLLGIIKSQRGAYDEALIYLDRALRAHPISYEALYNRAATLSKLKRYSDAIDSYDRALALKPDCVHSCTNRGDALQAMARYSEAIASYDRALLLRPDHIEALNNRGNALCAAKRYQEALDSYDQALSFQPACVESLMNRANALQAMGLYTEALGACDAALSHKPDYAEALNNRGVALHHLERYSEALDCYDMALSLHPTYAQALYNRGNVLRDLKRHGDAVRSYDLALAHEPEDSKALNNRGFALQAQGCHREALDSYARALSVAPDYADAAYNKSMLLLLLGEFETGWTLYEWRWKRSDAPPQRQFTASLWLGEQDLSGKRILLHAEQGLGDTVQFSRYARAVAEMGAEVLLQVPRPLHALLRAISGASEVFSEDEPLPKYDFQCPLMSLPYALRTTLENIPSETPYLKAEAQRLSKWSARLGPTRRLRVGLAWSGNAKFKNDENRTIALTALSPLFSLPVDWVCLQKEIREADRVQLEKAGRMARFENEIEDFSDTAALVELCDLVICVDTAVAHLAGALAKPVWILLPFAPDWRWQIDREDSPWYRSARLFRQQQPGDWNDVIKRVERGLALGCKQARFRL